MYKIAVNEEVPLERYVKYLNEETAIYIDPDYLRRAARPLALIAETRMKQFQGLLFATTSQKFSAFSKDLVIKYLINMGVPSEYFHARGSSYPNAYHKKIKEKIIYNGYAEDGFYIYEEYAKLSRQLKKVETMLLKSYDKDGTKGNYGQDLQRVRYNIEQKKNLRFNPNKENVIGFNGPLAESISAPEGMYILSCDFPQVDARVALNMYFKNDKINELSGQIADTYLVYKEFARWVQYESDKRELERLNSLSYYKPAPELEERVANYNPGVLPFQSKNARSIYKVTALQTVYYGRWSPFKEQQKAMGMLAKMYQTTERYARILNISKLMYKRKVPIKTRSRWGKSERVILAQDLNATLSSVFNAPSQATSSELVIMFITRFLDYFREKGYGKDKVRLCMNRHDEPVFYISQELFHEHIAFIASMRVVLVEGWSPMELDFFVGHTYKKNDDYAKSVLERVPSTLNQAKEEGARLASLEEPYPLIEPKIVTGAYRIINDTVRLALLWHEGELTQELNFDAVYEDKRDYNVKILNTKYEGDTRQCIIHMLNQFTSNFDDTEFIFLMDDVTDEDVTLNTAVAYIRFQQTNKDTSLANAVLATLAKSRGEEISKYDENLIKLLEDNKHRFKQG